MAKVVEKNCKAEAEQQRKTSASSRRGGRGGGGEGGRSKVGTMRTNNGKTVGHVGRV